MGRTAGACRGGKDARGRRRGGHPEETERFLRRLAGPMCNKPYRDGNGKEAHHCTTVNFTREIRSNPNESLCLCCRDSRIRISEKVWRARRRGAFIGVAISKLELDVGWTRRRDGRRFPVNRFLRTNAHVETFQALWCEMDRGSVREQWERLHAFGVFPTMVVRSGGKSLHAYWVLAEPTDRERFNAVMPRLCAQLLGDGKAISAMHQLRLPGSIHSKSLERGRLRRARLVHEEDRYPAIPDIEAALTLTPEEVTAYMDIELNRRRRVRAAGGGDGRADGRPARGGGDRAEARRRRETEDAELRAFDDGGDEAILGAAHAAFGDLRRGERHATTLALIRWCDRSMGLPEEDARGVVRAYCRRWPGTSEGATKRPGRVAREVDALVANWYAKPRAPAAGHASIGDLEECVHDISMSVPPDWSASDACGFHAWLTGFVGYMTAVAHRRGLTSFRRHSLHAKRDIERLGRAAARPKGKARHDCRKGDSRRPTRPDDRAACSQSLSRDGRRMAFRGFKLLQTAGVIVQAAEYLPDKRTRLYHVFIPIVPPDVWRRHRRETTKQWAARAARRAARGADGDGQRGVAGRRPRSPKRA